MIKALNRANKEGYMEQQDVFIAYHGTYDDNGSLAKAKELFYYLQSQGIKCV